MKKIFISALAIGFSLGVSAQGYTPALKLDAGKKYEIVTVIDGNNTAEVMGQSMETPIKSTSNAILDIKSATEKGYQSSYVTNRLQFYTSTMGQEMSYDSDKKEDKDTPMGKSLGNIVGGETTFTVNNDGNIIKETVVKPTEEKKDNDASDMMGSMMGGLASGNAGSCPAFDLFKSNKEIKIGESFVDSSSTEDKDGKSKNSTTYTLKEIKDGNAIFTIAGTSSIEKRMEQMGNEMTINTSIKSSGEVLVDAATGLLNKKTVISETTGTIDVQGMSIPMSGKTTMTITVNAK
ncbi:MAG: hypothetical protein KA319_07015 [Ferruginibacter sp.]|nr:hypothetical protein [Ferruginibacter sp.]